MKIVDEFIQRIASTGVMLSLGDGIVDTFVSACLSEEKWITIGGKQKGDEKHVGGFKVKIDGKGNIVKGRMKGTNVKDVKAKFDERKDKGRKIKPAEEKSQLPNFMKNIPSKSSNTLDLPGKDVNIPSTAAKETVKANESKGNKMSQTKNIVKSTSVKNVDNYKVGGIFEHDGEYVEVVQSSRRMDDHGAFDYHLAVRPASEDKVKAIKLDKAKKLLGDAYRSNDAVRIRKAENDIRAINGESLLPDINSHGEAKRNQAKELMAKKTDIPGRNSRTRNLMNESGLFGDAIISHEKVKSMSEEEIMAALKKISEAGDDEGEMNKNNQ